MSEYAEFNDQGAAFAPVRNLGAEVAELEAQRRQLQQDNAELKLQRDMLYAELAAYQEVQDKAQQKLNAVPVDAIRHLHGPSPVIPGRIESAWSEIGEWLKSYQGVQDAGV
jgi:FtsZ-binding cell division protein ZapB